MVKQGTELGAYSVHGVSKKEFTLEDSQFFGIDWTSVPCRALEVRITQPHLPHGAKGPAKRVRRTMLPWFCGLQKDLDLLEIPEAGTWTDLSRAHLSLRAGPATPSGLPNKYGSPPYPFPAAVPIRGLSPLSDAVVCLRRHDDLSVVRDKKLLLCGSDAERDEYIRAWRERAKEAAVEAWKEVQSLEEAAFGEKSYFLNLRNGTLDSVVDDEGDEDGEGYVHRHEEEVEQEELR